SAAFGIDRGVATLSSILMPHAKRHDNERCLVMPRSHLLDADKGVSLRTRLQREKTRRSRTDTHGCSPDAYSPMDWHWIKAGAMATIAPNLPQLCVRSSPT